MNTYTYTKTSVQFHKLIHNYLRHRKPPSFSFPMTSSLSNSAVFHRPFFTSKNPSTHRQNSLNFTTKSSPNDPLKLSDDPPPPLPEKRSIGVATGELFLGIASRLIKRRNLRENGVEINENDNVVFFEELNSSNNNGNKKKMENLFGFWNKKKEEEIAAVVDDGDVVWEQRLKDVEAERERVVVTSPGFSFSAAGLLFPYHLGVAKCLIEKGYIKDTTPLAGSSAGAIVCAVVASGASMEEALEATKILAQDCRSRGTAFRLGAVLRDVLEQFLPEDAHIRSNGRVRVAVTQILWRPRGLLVDQFDSREDLINAVITSSFIPGYLAPRPAILFRNRLCVDGGLTLFMPPTSAARTIRVCAFPASRLGLEDIGISPDCNPENRASPRELFNWALEPGADKVLDNLFELGYMDAAVWAALNPVDDLVQEDSPLVCWICRSHMSNTMV